jgi:hypothetical protein
VEARFTLTARLGNRTAALFGDRATPETVLAGSFSDLPARLGCRMSLRRGNGGYGRLSLVRASGFLRGLGQARCVGEFVVEVGFVLGGGLGDDAER